MFAQQRTLLARRIPCPAAIHQLDVLTGVWWGRVHISPSPLFPSGLTAIASYNGQLDLAGNVVVGHEQYRSEERLIHQALNIFGWDEERQLYTLYRFEAGQPHPRTPAFGQWQDQVLTLNGVAERGGCSFVYIFQERRYSVEQRLLSQPGGVEYVILEGKYERLGQ
jgi:hypothetical protein